MKNIILNKYLINYLIKNKKLVIEVIDYILK